MNKVFLLLLLSLLWMVNCYAQGRYLGQFSLNKNRVDSVSNPYGKFGSEYSTYSINNQSGEYGSVLSNKSATNPNATNPPKLYDRNGNFRGNLSTSPSDLDSISNPDGRYGSKLSPESINNPLGAGNPYRLDSPYNPYGEGLSIYSDEKD